jgi:UDP-glucuronate 4-epimerase
MKITIDGITLKNNMRVLVTGARGFIGSHLSASLANEGIEVVGIDNMESFWATFNDIPRPKCNIQDMRDNMQDLPYRRFRLMSADIRDWGRMRELFKEMEFDVVVHLAAKAGVRPSIKDPAGYARTNITGTVNLLEACLLQKTMPKFIFASSSSVYGNNRKVPFSENDVVDFPISPYAATKKAGELICHTYHHLHQMPMTCLRFFTVYGPRQRHDLAINKFAKLILARQPIERFGSGHSSRDYTYVDDIVDGIKSAIYMCSAYQIINLGSKNPITLNHMIETISQVVGHPAVILNRPMQPGDVDTTYADISKAERLLGYQPKTSFLQGVTNQVEYLKKQF